MKNVRRLMVISTLTIALSGPALAQIAYTPGMPGNGRPQSMSPGWTQQPPHYAPVPRPRQDQSRLPPDAGGQQQSLRSPAPGPPQLGPPLGDYDAPVARSEPDHTELETCNFPRGFA
jgi:hypothetical protein